MYASMFVHIFFFYIAFQAKRLNHILFMILWIVLWFVIVKTSFQVQHSESQIVIFDGMHGECVY